MAEIFKLIYDKLGYLKYDRIYKRFFERFYIFNIIKQLRIYIRYYFNCQIKQISKYKFYNLFQFILILLRLFYIITIDFVLALPESNQYKYDYIINIIDKFNKIIIFIAGKIAIDEKK